MVSARNRRVINDSCRSLYLLPVLIGNLEPNSAVKVAVDVHHGPVVLEQDALASGTSPSLSADDLREVRKHFAAPQKGAKC